jgi:hypothetical protein
MNILNPSWKFEVDFSYSQVLVYDCAIELPGLNWTEKHVAQGFARQESCAGFGTLLEFGVAKVHARVGMYKANKKYERVVAVPFSAITGDVFVEGPEDTEPAGKIAIAPAYYRLVVAQRVVDDENQLIDLFFEPLVDQLKHSEVLVSDEDLDPSLPLMESAETA